MPGPGKEKKARLAPGNAWIAGQVAAMEIQYKDALVAATMILQFQADSKAIGYKSRPPTRLQTRLTAAWRNYDAIRRHVEWYISQNVEYAAAPDKFAARRPPPLAPQLLPTPSPASAVPAHMQHTPAAASPVPLSSGFLSKPDPAAVDNIFEGMSIEGMSMEELNAFIGGSDFAQAPQVAAVQQQPEDAMTPTSKLFASLNASNSPKVSPTQQTQPTPSQPPAPPPAMPAGGDDDFDFSNVDLSNIDLTAFDGIFDADGGAGGGAGTGDAGTNTTNAAGVTSIPTNTSALAGSSAFNFEAFLNSGDGAGNAAGQSQQQPPSQPMQAAPGQARVSAPQPPPPAPQPPQQQPIQPTQPAPQPQQPPVQPAPVPAPAPAQPAPPPAPVPPAAPQDSFDSGEFGDIDFDGFNFDDMPDVNGDEFASLLAEFK
ncbi:hypothetical protein CspHIS471_0510360 [Cutaneotrichosporon sp. HIS471]|nr:hypothetical protein CspHIS471_0510360 [Cutaneotrichosporon sp. HIS471]